MTTLIIYTAAVYGIAWVISCSKIGKAVRARNGWPLEPLLSCVACTAFWASLFVTSLMWREPLLVETGWLARYATLALYSTGVSWLIGRAWGDAD